MATGRYQQAKSGQAAAGVSFRYRQVRPEVPSHMISPGKAKIRTAQKDEFSRRPSD